MEKSSYIKIPCCSTPIEALSLCLLIICHLNGNGKSKLKEKKKVKSHKGHNKNERYHIDRYNYTLMVVLSSFKQNFVRMF